MVTLEGKGLKEYRPPQGLARLRPMRLPHGNDCGTPAKRHDIPAQLEGRGSDHRRLDLLRGIMRKDSRVNDLPAAITDVWICCGFQVLPPAAFRVVAGSDHRRLDLLRVEIVCHCMPSSEPAAITDVWICCGPRADRIAQGVDHSGSEPRRLDLLRAMQLSKAAFFKDMPAAITDVWIYCGVQVRHEKSPIQAPAAITDVWICGREQEDR